MKKILILLGMVSFSMTACNHDNTTTDSENTGTTTATPASTATTDYSSEYQDRARQVSRQMANDLKFDTATAAKVEQVYYNRERRLDEARKKYNLTNNATVRTSGNAESTDDNAVKNNEMLDEMQIINGEVDSKLHDILKPDQYKAYEGKRAHYFTNALSSDNTARNITKDSDEITVQMGDIKVKAEPGKSKVETPTYESKIKGDERKFKSKTSDTKIKSEPGKVKYESGDTKIKVKDKD